SSVPATSDVGEEQEQQPEPRPIEPQQEQDLLADLRAAEATYVKAASQLLDLAPNARERGLAKDVVKLARRAVKEKKEAMLRAGIAIPDGSDDESDAESSHPTNRALSKKVALVKDLKTIPRWDASWTNYRDLDVFLVKMDQFKKALTKQGELEMTQAVASQVWEATVDKLRGLGYELVDQFEAASTWEEMRECFREWFDKSDALREAYHFDNLRWEKDVPIAQFIQRFRSAARACGQWQPKGSDAYRWWLAK
ncbi:hypothetical protein BGZ99_003547, partial [Dissophora globulifera]